MEVKVSNEIKDTGRILVIFFLVIDKYPNSYTISTEVNVTIQARTRGVKSNPTTIDEQRAELEEYRYKLDMFESRLRNSSFMDPEDRRILREQVS